MLRTLGAALLVAGLAVVLILTANAQCPDQWVRHISAIPSGALAGPEPSIATDQLGSIYYAARATSVDSIAIGDTVINMPNTGNTGNNDILVVKLSGTGALLWVKPIAGVNSNEPNDMVIDSLGDIYIGGRLTGPLTIDGTEIESPDSMRSGYFIIKLNSNGEYVWHKSTSIRGSRCYNLDWVDGYGLIAAFPFDGSIEIGGITYYSDSPELQDILIVRISADGQEVTYMNKIGGSGNIQMYNMACDGAGCIIDGRFSEQFQADQLIINTPNINHYYLFHANMELTGDLLWANHSTNLPDGANLFHGLGIGDSSIVFYGQSPFSWIEYGGVTIAEDTDPNHVFTRYFIGSMSRQNGELNWLKPIIAWGSKGSPGNVLHSNAGTWVSTGNFDSTFTFQGFLIENEQSSIIRLDADGKPECGTGIGGSIGSIIRTFDGHVVANLEFDSNTSIEVFGQTLTSHGGIFDVAIVKTCLPCDTLTSISEATTSQPTLFLYPNPANQSVRVEVQSSTFKVQSLSVTDMLGQVVQNLESQTLNFEMDIAGLANGIYTVAVQDQTGQLLRQRLVVQH